MSTSIFEVSKQGLAQIMERRGKGFVLAELYQNAVDEDVTRVEMTLEPVAGKPLARIRVEDDSPTGFRDLSDAFVLFKPSYKRDNPQLRGRFSLGEKLIIAIATEAEVSTTTGTVVFDASGRSHYPRRKRDRGSVFEGTIRMTRDEYDEACQVVKLLLPPDGVKVLFNGAPLPHRTPVASFETTLPTELADADGYLKPTRRKTLVHVYEPLEGETAQLYELGIPVVATGDRYHVSIEQKVPVSLDRTNLITPGFLRDVRATVLNHTAHLLSKDDASERWLDDALEDDQISPEALKEAVRLRFGPKVVLTDPSDREGEKIAVSQGYTVIPSRGLSKKTFANLRKHSVVLPAGRVTPSPKPYSSDPNARVRDELPQEKWTLGIRAVARLSQDLGRLLLGREITVRIVSDPNVMNFAATYRRADGQLEYNLRKLGYKWFDRGATEDVLQLIIHEFGHQFSDDHLSSRYHEALCRLGAKLALLVAVEGFDLEAYTLAAQEQLERGAVRGG